MPRWVERLKPLSNRHCFKVAVSRDEKHSGTFSDAYTHQCRRQLNGIVCPQPIGKGQAHSLIHDKLCFLLYLVLIFLDVQEESSASLTKNEFGNLALFQVSSKRRGQFDGRDLSDEDLVVSISFLSQSLPDSLMYRFTSALVSRNQITSALRGQQ